MIELREAFRKINAPYINVTEPYSEKFFNLANGSLVSKTLVVVPIYSILRDPTLPDSPPNNLTSYLGMTFKDLGGVQIKAV